MAWTTPYTFTADEVVSASRLNTHIRDNMLETAPALVSTAGDTVYASGANALARLGIGSAFQVQRVNSGATAPEWADHPKVVIKTANQSKNNDTTVAADSVLKFAIAANEHWMFEFSIFWQAHVDGNILTTIDVPAGATGRWALGRQQGTASIEPTYITLGFGTDQGIEADASSQPRGTHIFGGVFDTGTGGDVEFAWAQLASHATATTVLDYSSLKAFRIA